MVIRTLLSLLAFLCCNTVAAQTFYVCEGPDTRTAQQIVFTDGSMPTASVDSITLSVPRGQRFVGGDISVLTKYEQQQATYLDRDGKAIGDVLTFLREQGWNTMRVRLFVDPSQDSDKNVCQDLDYVTSLAQRIKAAGLLLMLDFHYSDTWADPGKQTVPKSWKDFDLAQHIYDYTRECLAHLVAHDAAPDFIQTGNEISFGMLWESGHVSANSAWTAYLDTNWSTLATYLRQASKACREVCPRAQIIIHTEQCANNPTLDVAFFKRIAQRINAMVATFAMRQPDGLSDPARGQLTHQADSGGGDGLSFEMGCGRHFLRLHRHLSLYPRGTTPTHRRPHHHAPQAPTGQRPLVVVCRGQCQGLYGRHEERMVQCQSLRQRDGTGPACTLRTEEIQIIADT